MNVSPWKITLIPIAMFAFGFALVPLYDVFCEVTGLNGKNYSVQTEAKETPNQTITETMVVDLRLTADAESRDHWQFEPERKVIPIQSGKMIKTHYELTNPTDKPITIRAVPSIAPGHWAKYLVKIECFCFDEQAVPPNGTVELPLQVTLSANTPEEVNQLTLSYRIYLRESETPHTITQQVQLTRQAGGES